MIVAGDTIFQKIIVNDYSKSMTILNILVLSRNSYRMTSKGSSNIRQRTSVLLKMFFHSFVLFEFFLIEGFPVFFFHMVSFTNFSSHLSRIFFKNSVSIFFLGIPQDISLIPTIIIADFFLKLHTELL